MKVMSLSIFSGSESTGPDQASPRRGPFRHAEVLEERLAAAAAESKPVRTRLLLMARTSELLAERGFHGLRVADCVARAGLAHGTFYRYWPDLVAATRDVLADFLATTRTRRPPSAPEATLYARIRLANHFYAEIYRLNPMLMRCLVDLAHVQPEFARVAQVANLRLAQRVVRAWERADPTAAMLLPELRLARALACIAMVDGMLKELFLCNPELPLSTLSAGAVADMLSQAWYRILLGRDAAPEELGGQP